MVDQDLHALPPLGCQHEAESQRTKPSLLDPARIDLRPRGLGVERRRISHSHRNLLVRGRIWSAHYFQSAE